MEEKSMEELKDEATSLGLEFKGNVSKTKLIEMIENKYAEATAGFDKPVVKEEKEVEKPVDAKSSYRAVIAKLKAEMLKTRVVRVTLNDKRENGELSSYYVANSVIGKHIPLDTPIELEQCLIDQLNRTKVPMHIDGPNGMKTTKMAKKFIIEYIQ